MHVQVVGVRREAALVGERQPVGQRLLQLVEARVPVEQLAEVGVAAGDRLVRAVPPGPARGWPAAASIRCSTSMSVSARLSVVAGTARPGRAGRPGGRAVRLPEDRAAGGRLVAQREHGRVVGRGGGHAPDRVAARSPTECAARRRRRARRRRCRRPGSGAGTAAPAPAPSARGSSRTRRYSSTARSASATASS